MASPEEPLSLDLWGTEELSRHARFLDSHRVQQNVFWGVVIIVEMAICAAMPALLLLNGLVAMPLLASASSQYWIVGRIRAIERSLTIEQLLAMPLAPRELLRFVVGSVMQRQWSWLLVASVLVPAISALSVMRSDAGLQGSAPLDLLTYALLSFLFSGAFFLPCVYTSREFARHSVLRALELILHDGSRNPLGLILHPILQWGIAISPVLLLVPFARGNWEILGTGALLWLWLVLPFVVLFWHRSSSRRERLLQSEPRVQWRILGER